MLNDHKSSRNQVIRQLEGEAVDVLVVGGGIVGSGVARDAAMRGLRTALVDKFDFAFGTSSRSSRLLHGGLRYLAQGRLKLVREASVEKVVISRIAPHLATPLPFIFPTRRGTDWRRWKLGVGVKVYDFLCSGRNLGRSSAMSREEVLDVLPGLNASGLSGAVRYYDAFTNDARLVLDTLRSAAANGATLMNYAAFETAQRHHDLWHCGVFDSAADSRFEIRAKCVINAAGAWANEFPASRVALRLTKGAHLVIDRARLAIPEAVVMSEGERILFAIPWGERVILGTTDTDYAGPVDSPACEPEDMSYILGVANKTFPSARLEPDDVISTWAGLRPLIAGRDTAGKPSDISRRHLIRMNQPGWIDVAGGKLTTYRLMAEQTVDQIMEFTGASAKPCQTGEIALLPGDHKPLYSGILPPAMTREAVEHYCRHEWAIHLADVMIRRSSWRYHYREHVTMARQVAAWMAEALGWDAAHLEQEVSSYQQATGGRGSIQPRPTAA